MANVDGWKFSGLTGGTNTDLDGKDGDECMDGAFAIVLLLTGAVFYEMDINSGAVADGVSIIAPAVNAGTKRWIQKPIGWLTDLGGVFFHANLVNEPVRLAWSVGDEERLGIGVVVSPVSNTRFGVAQLASESAWASIVHAGAVGEVTADDVYATVVDISNGSGVVTNVIMPGVTSAGDAVSLRITIDGSVHELSFTADDETDRVVSGVIESISTYSNDTCHNMWPDAAQVSGLANRLPYGGLDVRHVMAAPSYSLGNTPCLRFVESLKVEMKSSDVSATNQRQYCAVAYTIDQ